MDPSFLQQLFADSRKMRKGSDTTAYEAFMGFYHAVRWRDAGVMALLGFHAVYATVCLLLRRHPTVHIALFLLTCGLSYSATHINVYLAAHWREYGFSQNYFDRHGVFMSSLFCAPLLIVAFAQMLYSLAVSCDLLVKVKRAELKQHLRDRRKAEAEGGSEAAAVGDAAGTPKPAEGKKQD